ncbi:MAG: enoyl-CoA hydratase/isomerase family protein [Chloroflexi bacterium]|nr:enoyl-CoA hydratase/isomerase family protein [Chloroflexota bacterium]
MRRVWRGDVVGSGGTRNDVERGGRHAEEHRQAQTRTNGYGSLLLMEKNARIARITFNRQDKRNAMNSAMMAEFRVALRDSWDYSVVTISGGDGRGFCSGIDLSEGRSANAERQRNYEDFMGTWERTNYLIWEHPAVCIASVNGYALAGGLSLVCSCDLTVASEKAQFGMPEMGFGTFPGLVAPLNQKNARPFLAGVFPL